MGVYRKPRTFWQEVGRSLKEALIPGLIVAGIAGAVVAVPLFYWHREAVRRERVKYPEVVLTRDSMAAISKYDLEKMLYGSNQDAVDMLEQGRLTILRGGTKVKLLSENDISSEILHGQHVLFLPKWRIAPLSEEKGVQL